MSNDNLIAFVDLLGTSELSRVDPDSFRTSLTTFEETICNSSSYLGKTGEVYFFSDCAYIQSASIDSLVKYIRDVRQALLEQGLYLKGSIGSGSLGAHKPLKGGIVKGNSFGADVVQIYALQDGLRGIGIRIDESIYQAFKNKGYTINSCHLPLINSRHAECFHDLQFSTEELNEEVLKIFIKNFFKTNTKSRRFGRYYLSFVVSWINSADFGEIGRGDAANKLENMPLIFQIMLDGLLERHFTDLAGMEFIYFTFLQKVYKQCRNQKIITRFEKYVASRKRLIARLEMVPRCLFDEESRRKFLDYLSGRVTGSL
jgi:hypothetical protein